MPAAALRSRLLSAALGGHVHAVQWLVDSGRGVPSVEVMAAAVSKGHAHVVRWLRSGKGCPWDESVLAAAARAGQVELLRSLRAEGCPASPSVYLPSIRGETSTRRGASLRRGAPWTPR